MRRAHQDPPPSLIPTALLFALGVRLLPALLLPQTSFQPDEFYQSLEPAHALVYGYGHLTWEWKDLPLIPDTLGASISWYDRVVVGGRMRSWIWPGVFAALYRGLEAVGAGERWLILGPRLVGALIAALTDYTTYLLGVKLLGPGAGPSAMFLSLTSLFNAHILPRALSTSPETLLTTVALLYFPLSPPEAVDVVLTRSAEASAVKASSGGIDEKGTHRLDSSDDMDYVMIDRIPPHLEENEAPGSSLAISAATACLAVCIRPTTLPFWAYLGVEHTVKVVQTRGSLRAARDVLTALTSATLLLAASTGVDYAITGRLYFPVLTFIHYNLFTGLSANYGSTSLLYHLTQSMPIMLFPIWYWFGKGFVSALLPGTLLPTRLAMLDRPAGLRTVSRALTFAITALSFSPHSEWRFLHPFLPALLLFALPPLSRSYIPVLGDPRISTSFRQYIRLSKRSFYLILLAPVVPYLYLNIFHGRAQVEVINALRRGEADEVKDLIALMPCHSTPWMSHLHRDIPAWFMTCAPPIGQDRPERYSAKDAIFYTAPVSYIQKDFPTVPLSDHMSYHDGKPGDGPSHLILFGSLLDMRENGRSVADALTYRGYEEVWRMWNGFDWAQDEEKRRGGVRIWRMRGDVVNNGEDEND